MASLSRSRWLLLSDIHFRLRDFERTRRTAEWIVSLTRQTPDINRVVVCGDVLTSRSMQPTAVISAAYRFLSDLSDSVPHVNVILGNHDLAYRRDYGTTALEALKMSHLKPFISLHEEVGKYTWDGRRVLILPFHEDQTELTTAVADLDPDEAAHTVAFAHLAINRAVTQRHVVRNDGGGIGSSVRYRGLTGPDHFSTLARTFTGHFHSHQTILQSNKHVPPTRHEDHLMGSLTYLGAPLQLTWADLCDEDRGVVLLNPETLEHELIINPYAVGYTTIQGSEVMGDNLDASAVQGKHVMILGEFTQFQYWTARDKLLSLGAQSVREPRPTSASLNVLNSPAYNSLGASVPESDRSVAFRSAEPRELLEEPSESTIDEPNVSLEPDHPQPVEIDPVECVRGYVRSMEVESMYEEKTIQLGQKLILASESTTSLGDEAVSYKTLLDPTHSIAVQGDVSAPAKRVFVARPQLIVISNFLGIQEECTIDFDGDLGRGLAFVVGSNGSGKSTLFEAIVWCQFGRCIRKGLTVGDVVNDTTGKNCMVSLSFSNGYTITRYRKHGTHGNRVVISLHGIDQPQFEHGEVRATQAAIDELLGIDYETFVRTVVLERESAASFLSSTPAQRHDMIESTLKLSSLDKTATLSRRMMREIDDDANALNSEINVVRQTMSLINDRISNRKRELKRLESEARKEIDLAEARANRDKTSNRDHRTSDEDLKKLIERLEKLELEIKESQQAVERAESSMKDVEIWEDVATLRSSLDQSIRETKSRCQSLRDDLSRLRPEQPDPVIMEYIRTFESAHQGLAQTISWLRLYALKTIEYLNPNNPVNRMVLHFIQIGLMSLERISSHLNSLLEQAKSSVARQQQDMGVTDNVIKKIQKKLVEGESNMTRLIKEKDEAHARVAVERGLDEQYVRSLSNKLSDIDVRKTGQQLSLSHRHLSKLLNEQRGLQELRNKSQRERIDAGELARDQERKREREREALLRVLAMKEQEIVTYRKLIEDETQTLNEQLSSHTALEADIESLMSTRKLFAFWDDSLSRRRMKSPAMSTFRSYVLDKSLQEVNAVASNILLLLYENTRHARELTKGMLRTIIADDPEADQGPVLLDPTLGVTKTLSYAKRSSGERKRVDLAVFFALVQIAQARSTHRARYMLVDEVFDSLDAAGQAAVVRQSSKLMSRTDFQLVVTHSESLTGSAPGVSNDEGGDDGQNRLSILSAAMTDKGTKFSYSMA
ncbi:P-loop containing nucleoside triphosphate hydrolase protein [Xylaria digitata]|nr:P-loop containing nucleoside triphosphate hydrolase protein [Xylaria digitata]